MAVGNFPKKFLSHFLKKNINKPYLGAEPMEAQANSIQFLLTKKLNVLLILSVNLLNKVLEFLSTS